MASLSPLLLLLATLLSFLWAARTPITFALLRRGRALHKKMRKASFPPLRGIAAFAKANWSGYAAIVAISAWWHAQPAQPTATTPSVLAVTTLAYDGTATGLGTCAAPDPDGSSTVLALILLALLALYYRMKRPQADAKPRSRRPRPRHTAKSATAPDGALSKTTFKNKSRNTGNADMSKKGTGKLSTGKKSTGKNDTDTTKGKGQANGNGKERSRGKMRRPEANSRPSRPTSTPTATPTAAPTISVTVNPTMTQTVGGGGRPDDGRPRTPHAPPPPSPSLTTHRREQHRYRDSRSHGDNVFPSEGLFDGYAVTGTSMLPRGERRSRARAHSPSTAPRPTGINVPIYDVDSKTGKPSLRPPQRGKRSKLTKSVIEAVSNDDSLLKGKSLISASGSGLMCLLSAICIAMTGGHSAPVVTQLREAMDSATSAITGLDDNLSDALHTHTGAFATQDETAKTRMLGTVDLIIAAVAVLGSLVGFRVWSTTADGTENGPPLDHLTVVAEMKGTTNNYIDLLLERQHYYVFVNGKPNGSTLDISGCMKNFRIPTPDEAARAVADLANGIAKSATSFARNAQQQQRPKPRRLTRSHTAAPPSAPRSASSEEEESASVRSSTTLSGSTDTDSDSDSSSHDGNASAGSGSNATVSLNPRSTALRRSVRFACPDASDASPAASAAAAPSGMAAPVATA